MYACGMALWQDERGCGMRGGKEILSRRRRVDDRGALSEARKRDHVVSYKRATANWSRVSLL